MRVTSREKKQSKKMSEEKDRGSKSVQVPTFNGKKATFGIWWPRFRAYCTVKKIVRALYQSFALPPDPSKVPSKEEEKKDFLKLIQDNDECVAGLTLAFTTTQLMEFVVQSETAEYP